jgi:uncharacterized protein YbjT (DUF2867 family)
MRRSALIVGATGLVGRHCLAALLEDDEYESVAVLARRSFAREHPKLRAHVMDFDEPASYRRLAVGNDVFCCLGTTIRTAGSQQAFSKVDFSYPVAVAEAALANGAEQFLIVSALGANPNARAFYSRVKGAVERAVTGMPFKAVHVFRPSLLVGNRAEFRLAERVAISTLTPLSFLFAGPLRRYRPIQASVVGERMVTVAKMQLTGVHVYESEQIGGFQ